MDFLSWRLLSIVEVHRTQYVSINNALIRYVICDMKRLVPPLHCCIGSFHVCICAIYETVFRNRDGQI